MCATLHSCASHMCTQHTDHTRKTWNEISFKGIELQLSAFHMCTHNTQLFGERSHQLEKKLKNSFKGVELQLSASSTGHNDCDLSLCSASTANCPRHRHLGSSVSEFEGRCQWTHIINLWRWIEMIPLYCWYRCRYIYYTPISVTWRHTTGAKWKSRGCLWLPPKNSFTGEDLKYK